MEGDVVIQSQLMAYVSQQAWIQNASVKDNILFGDNLEDIRQWYEDVVEACALKDDFAQLIEGEETLIGENGINLSGGQKQRVAIARAVLKRRRGADLFLMDDPLSALDSHKSKHVFKKVLSNEEGVLRGTTRILVTHHMNLLRQVDFIMMIKEGEVMEFGPPKRIFKAGSELSLLMEEFKETEEQQEKEVAVKEDKKAKKEEKDTNDEKKEKDSSSKAKEARKRINDESVLSGRVKLRAYDYYVRSFGYMSFLIILALYVGNQTMSTGSTIWIAAWSDKAEEARQADNGTFTDNDFYIGVLGAFGLGQAVMSFTRNLFFYLVCARGSTRIHNALFSAIIHGRMRFFDTTSTGAIVNRFSGDMTVVDQTLPVAVNSLLFAGGEILAVLVVISVSFPVLTAVIIPLAVVYYFLMPVYIPSSRQIKRFESRAKSPINLHFSETVQGAAVIRAFGEELRFSAESAVLVGKNLHFQYVSQMMRRWLSLRSDLVGNVVVLLAGLLAVAQKDAVTAGWVGLTISYAMSATETFQWVLNHGTRVEELAVGVERIRETEKYTPQEATWRNIRVDPEDQKWLKKGSIEFKDYSMSYAPDLDPVLQGLNLSINAGEKIGVCGRTGAGKSSLSVALFNLVESWKGQILLDGVDIGPLGLHTLRSQLTIIPQDPVLFNRSIRENLDPAAEHHDDKLWTVLEQSQMKVTVKALKSGLDHEVEEGGANFSVGQRQLMCLARALLRDLPIVLLDEATASMDSKTDELVQETLFSELGAKTVVTIAHRLDTILNYDRILVLDKGRISEFDTPKNLLNDKNSVFYSMMQKHQE